MLDSYIAIVTHPMLILFLTMCAVAYSFITLTSIPSTGIRRSINALWMREHYVILVIVAALIIAALAIWFYLFEIGLSVRHLVDRLDETIVDPNSETLDVRNLASSVAVLAGVLAVSATLVFSLIRVWVNERTAIATEEKLVTEQIANAVELLGHENPIVRTAAIHMFERIMAYSEKDRYLVLRTLNAYLQTSAKPDTSSESIPETPADFQATIDVLSRWNEHFHSMQNESPE